jgi:hypothetical protein
MYSFFWKTVNLIIPFNWLNSLSKYIMICSVALLIAALLLQSQHIYATGTNNQVNADIDYGTFQDPSAIVRPKFRYWPNDASVNLTQVQDDVREAGRVGAGGIELLGYYFYGDLQLFPGNYYHLESDWTIYGFGSPAWSGFPDYIFIICVHSC